NPIPNTPIMRMRALSPIGPIPLTMVSPDRFGLPITPVLLQCRTGLGLWQKLRRVFQQNLWIAYFRNEVWKIERIVHDGPRLKVAYAKAPPTRAYILQICKPQ